MRFVDASSWHVGAALALSLGLVAAAGCDLEPDAGLIDDGKDTTTGPPGCPTNWLPVQEGALEAGHARVAEGALVLGPGADEVEVRALLGAQPVEGRKFVLRLELSKLALGASGKLEIDLTSPSGPLAAVVVQNAGAVLMVEAFPEGKLVEIPLSRAPTQLMVELESRPDLSIAVRVFFGAAGDGKVYAIGVDRFDGGVVTPALTLTGRDAEVRLDRYAKVDATGGVADDFACNTLGTAFDRDRWPAARLPNEGGRCGQEFECGAGERCLEGVCRATCLASGECPDSICLVGVDGATCRLPSETCDPLPDGLVCGPDATARLGCGRSDDCPGPDDLCIGGACVANDEPLVADGPGWGSCPAGVTRCADDDIQVCDLGGPGWTHVAACDVGQCLVDAAGARCDDCLHTCQADDVYERCGAATDYTVAEDCPDGVSVCSTGDNAREAPHCRALIGPKAVSTSVAVGGFAIDPTEVTRAQYTAFLRTQPDPAAQPAACAWNTSFEPKDWPWFDAPERAAQVDFCDAQAFCSWAGKRVCGAVSGGPVTAAALGNPSIDAWFAACTAGGQLEYPYGDTFEPGRCSNDSKRDVGTSPGCTTTVVGYTGVFDLVGGVGEWIDACAPQSGPTPDADSCRTRGTSPSEPCSAARTLRRDSKAGIRCCAEP